MDNAGILSLIRLSDPEKDIFLDYMMYTKKTEVFDILNNFFEDDFFKFLDIFAGRNMKMMKRKELYSLLRQVQIYHYVSTRGYTQKSVEDAARIFDRRRISIMSTVNEILRGLGKEEKFDYGQQRYTGDREPVGGSDDAGAALCGVGGGASATDRRDNVSDGCRGHAELDGRKDSGASDADKEDTL